MSEFHDTMEWAAALRFELSGGFALLRCSRCGIPESKCPLAGFDEDGHCLVCVDYLDEQRSDVVGERLRSALDEADGTEQTGMEVFA